MGDWTIDEEMFRERLRAVADSLDAFAVASLLRDASVSLNEYDRQIVRQQAEIKRLRAEVAKRQALIDAFVVADLDPDDSGYDAAYAALLAAATKGAADGR